jgi:hypothetical protein
MTYFEGCNAKGFPFVELDLTHKADSFEYIGYRIYKNSSALYVLTMDGNWHFYNFNYPVDMLYDSEFDCYLNFTISTWS